MPQRIAIIGAGNLGRALSRVIKGRADVVMWDKDAAKVSGQGTLEDAVKGSVAAFLCVPSWALNGTLEDVARTAGGDTVIVGMSKGIESRERRTLDELFAAAVPPPGRWALLSGPMLAAELDEGKGGAAVVAAVHEGTAAAVASVFAGTALRVEPSTDVRGTALAGVLKNVYAMSLGMADALGWEGNMKGWLVAQAVREMRAAIELLGGDPSTALGPAGLGDLVATGFSPHSKNRTYGFQIVLTGACPFESEGCASLPHLLSRLGGVPSGMPLLAAVRDVIVGHADAKATFDAVART